MKRTVGVIPARFHATRFEGKVLALIDKKPMIQHVWERAKHAKLLDDVLVACDDDRIKKAVGSFGGTAIITAKGHTTGTERICEVVNQLDVDIVVNIQGDEPLIHPSMIDSVVEALREDGQAMVATLVKKIEDAHEAQDPNVVKVVFDRHRFALYFSRSCIPFVRDQQPTHYYKHIGLYAYKKDFLFTYKKLPQLYLEQKEKLEQLRILEHGFRIKVAETPFDTIGVDTPEDLERVKQQVRR